MVSLMCFATSCYDYSKSLTKDKQMTSDLILETVKPDRTYAIKLKTGMEYKVRVKTIDRDSLSGSFYMIYPRVRKQPKIASTISLQEIQEVKGEKFLVVPTVLAILVPIGVGFVILDNIRFSPFH